jgi:hypothetical protein
LQAVLPHCLQANYLLAFVAAAGFTPAVFPFSMMLKPTQGAGVFGI